MRCPDRPEGIWRSELVSLRERLDALPANHPASPDFAVDAALADGSGQEEAAGEHDRPEPDGGDVDPDASGSVDQGARAFLPTELAIAEALADRGAAVVALAEDPE